MKRLIQFTVILALPSFLLLWGCGGGGSSTASNSSGGGTGGSSSANSVALSVGPGSFANGYANGLYTTISVCQPGTSNCTSLDHVLVDTGSTGLRILATELPSGFTLPTAKSGSNSLYECLSFLDSYAWGAVATADVELSGEKASSLPVQLISSAAAPSTCSNTLATPGSPEITSEADLGARAIIGVGNFASDCGDYCTTPASLDMYFGCSSSTASSCSQVGVPVAQQVDNPVALFSTDNNGVVIQLASVPTGGEDSASGNMYFGIATQADNTPAAGLTVLDLNDVGDFGTNFQSTSLPDSFADTGSNALFFGTINANTLKTSTGITGCNLGTSANPAYFYCPSSELSETATIAGGDNPATTKSVSFNVGNANTLAGGALSDLAGPDATSIPDASTSFDWGLPFFFGRSVYVGFEGASSPLGSDLYIAF